jgi:adenylosuccinate lyase
MEPDLTATRIHRTPYAECFSELARWSAWLVCEAALAMAEVDAGIVPLAAAYAIAQCCDVTRLNAPAIARAMEEQGHALTPVLTELCRVVTDAASEEVSRKGFRLNPRQPNLSWVIPRTLARCL